MGGSFIPKQQNWHWMQDDAAEPTTQYANENTTFTLSDNGDILRLRITIAETGNKAANNISLKFEYSTDESSWYTPGASNAWDYADGLGTQGNNVTTNLCTDTTGKGEYVEASGGAGTFDFVALTSYEFDFAITPGTGVSGSTLYYFRILINDAEVVLNTAETHPSATTAAQITQVTFAGTSAGTATTTASSKKIASFGGVAQGVASVLGALVLTASLAGVSAGASTASGALTVLSTVTLAGTSDGASSVAGSASATKSLAGTSGGSASVSGALTAGGWLSGWGFRKEITVQDTYVDGNLTDFPLYVKINADADFHEARSDGYDIRFTQDDGETLLKYEREYWTGGNGSAATAHFWVKVPSILSSGGATIYCYYGKSDATDGEDATNTWRTEYKAVLHLGESYSTGSGNYKDSSGNANHGTCQDSDADCSQVNGPYYKAFAQPTSGLSTDDIIDFGAGATLDIFGASADFTVQAWKYEPTTTSRTNIIGIGSSSTKGCLFWGQLQDTNSPYFYSLGNTEAHTASGSVTLDDWNHLVFTADRSGNSTWYINGSASGTNDISDTETENWNRVDSTHRIGCDRDGTLGAYGYYAEVRYYAGLLPAEWVKFEYYNINESDQELTWGNEETEGAGAVTFAGASAGSASASGAIQKTGQFAGASAGQSSASGSVHAIRSLNGSSGGIATVSGALSVGGEITLQGASAGVSSVSGTIQKVAQFAGQSAGDATVLADIAVIRALTAQSAGSATVSAEIEAIKALSGLSSGQATVSGSLTAEGEVTLRGASTGTSTADASIEAIKSLSGISAGEATVSGALTVEGQVALAGTSAGQATVSGILSNIKSLQGTSTGQATADAIIGRIRELTGASAGESTADALIRLVSSLSGSSQGVSTVEAFVRALYALSGASDGTSTVTGELYSIQLPILFQVEPRKREFDVKPRRRIALAEPRDRESDYKERGY